MKSLIAAFVIFPAVAFASNCKIDVSTGPYFEHRPSKSIERMIARGLAKKGYTLGSKEDSEYVLYVNHALACGEKMSFYTGTHMRVMNSGRQEIAEANADANIALEIAMLAFGNGPSVKESTRRAFRRLLKNLPECKEN